MPTPLQDEVPGHGVTADLAFRPESEVAAGFHCTYSLVQDPRRLASTRRSTPTLLTGRNRAPRALPVDLARSAKMRLKRTTYVG